MNVVLGRISSKLLRPKYLHVFSEAQETRSLPKPPWAGERLELINPDLSSIPRLPFCRKKATPPHGWTATKAGLVHLISSRLATTGWTGELSEEITYSYGGLPFHIPTSSRAAQSLASPLYIKG